MKKNILALSVATLLSATAFAQNTTTEPMQPAPMSQPMMKEHKDVEKMNKKVVKENEKTNKELRKDKISGEQAQKLHENERHISEDAMKRGHNGELSREDKKDLKKEIDRNQDMRDEMKDVHKEEKKNR